MKAAMLREWGNLELVQLEKPIPKENEALIKVIYGGVCGSDITVYRGLHLTARAPVVLCHEILGTVEQLPLSYQGNFIIGQRVVVNPIIACGQCAACQAGIFNACANLKLLGIHVNGGFEEYVCASVESLVAVPAALPDQIAALSEPFAVGKHVNRRAGIERGMRVLVIGAGTIGLVIALTARELGAEVHISEMNGTRRCIAKDLAFQTVNPNETDVITYTQQQTGNAGFDVVFDTASAKSSVLQLPDLCRIGGKILSLGLSGAAYEFIIGKVSFKEQTLIGSRLYLKEDFENGVHILEGLVRKYDLTKLISNVMTLDEIKQAIEMMMYQKNAGKILIDCAQ